MITVSNYSFVLPRLLASAELFKSKIEKYICMNGFEKECTLHVRGQNEIINYKKLASEMGMNIFFTRFVLNKEIRLMKMLNKIKENINITVDAFQRKRLIEEAHKRNLV